MRRRGGRGRSKGRGKGKTMLSPYKAAFPLKRGGKR